MGKFQSCVLKSALALTIAMPGLETAGALVNHLDFNDAGNGGLNLLKAGVGNDAEVKTGSGTVTTVNGLGNLYSVSGEGRTDGTGAIRIPSGQFLSLAHGVLTNSVRPWCLVMRVRDPDATLQTGFKAFYSTLQDNSGDGSLFRNDADTNIGRNNHWYEYATGRNRYCGDFAPSNWHTVVVSFYGADAAPGSYCYLDDLSTPLLQRGSSRYLADSLVDKPYIYFTADDNGEDLPLEFDDIKIYDVARPTDVFGHEDGSPVENHWLAEPSLPRLTLYASEDVTVNLGEAEDGTATLAVDGVAIAGNVLHTADYAAGRHTLTLTVPQHCGWSTLEKEIEFHVEPDTLVSHYTFDDPQNLLRASVGADGVIRKGRGGSVSSLSGLGLCTATNGEGHADGAGALCIPYIDGNSQFLAIPNLVGKKDGHPWCMVLKCYAPAMTTDFLAFYSLSWNNNDDACLFCNKNEDCRLGSSDWTRKYSESAEFTENTWHTVVISCDGVKTRLWLDNAAECACNAGEANSRDAAKDSLDELYYIYVCGDNDGDDGTMFFDEIKVYAESAPPTVFARCYREYRFGDITARSWEPVTENWASAVKGRWTFTAAGELTLERSTRMLEISVLDVNGTVISSQTYDSIAPERKFQIDDPGEGTVVVTANYDAAALYLWIDEKYPDTLDFWARAKQMAANGENTVEDCYVAGLDPTNATSRFLATVACSNDMVYVDWTPNLNKGGVTRIYTVYGRATLDYGDWTEVKPWHRFFKVGVAMQKSSSDVATAVAGEGLVPQGPVGVLLWDGGPYWAECNLGASQPEEYGYYFWWGDTVGYRWDLKGDGFGDYWFSVANGSAERFSYRSCATSDERYDFLIEQGYIDSARCLVAAHDAATAHLGEPWRIPTDAEWSALLSHCDITSKYSNGVFGWRITGRDAFSTKSIFIPAAGYGYENTLDCNEMNGYYWSSTIGRSTSDDSSIYQLFGSDGPSQYIGPRFWGRSVRPVRSAK